MIYVVFVIRHFVLFWRVLFVSWSKGLFAVSIGDARLFIRLVAARPKSRCLRALGVGEDGIERLAGSHKETVFFCAAEAQIGAGLRQMDFADDFAIGSETVNAIEIPIRAERPSKTSLITDSSNCPGKIVFSFSAAENLVEILHRTSNSHGTHF